jgi:Zn-dependent protease
MLSCPACDTLVHADRLKQLAAGAEGARAEGRLLDESHAWQEALDLLPPTSKQYATIRERVTEITRSLIEAPGAAAPAKTQGPWYRQWGAGVGALVILLITKGKFLLLGLTKAKTLLSMFAFFGVYWSIYGWAFALGIVLSIYIHEMGHVYVLRKLGIRSGAPLFIPGFGAFILTKTHIDDPSVDARVGLAGPLWGLGAGVAAWLVYLVTRDGIWGAIASVTGFINLFNLIPIWQLDGARGFHALTRVQRLMAVAAIAVLFAFTHQRMLAIVGAVALFRAFQRGNTKPDHTALATYVFLIVALSLLSVTYSVTL